MNLLKCFLLSLNVLRTNEAKTKQTWSRFSIRRALIDDFSNSSIPNLFQPKFERQEEEHKNVNFNMSFYRLCFTSIFKHCSRHVCVYRKYILEKVRISLTLEIYLVCLFLSFFLVQLFFHMCANESSSDLLVYNRFCWILRPNHIKIDYIL